MCFDGRRLTFKMAVLYVRNFISHRKDTFSVLTWLKKAFISPRIISTLLFYTKYFTTISNEQNFNECFNTRRTNKQNYRFFCQLLSKYFPE